MRFSLILFFFTFFCLAEGTSQEQFQMTFSNQTETQGISVSYSVNGGYIVLSAARDTSASSIGLQKLNNTFSPERTVSLTTSDSAIFPVTSIENADGSIIVAAAAYNSNQTSILLMKMDSSGAGIWGKKYNRTNHEEPKSILTLPDGSFYLCGKGSYNTSSTQKDILLSRFSEDGQEQWTQLIGGTHDDDPSMIIRTSDDQLAIAGTSNSFSNGNNFFLCKLDTSGNYYWFITYILGLSDTCRSFIQTNDGGYLLVGTGGSNGQDIFIIKTDANGYLQFARTYNLGFSSNSLLDDGYKILSTSDGGIAIAGTTHLTTNQETFLFLIKLSQNLVTEWFSSYGFQLTNYLTGILQTQDNGYLMVGSRKNSSTNHFDGLLIKTDSAGISTCHETSLTKTDAVVNPLQFSAAPSAISVTFNVQSDSILQLSNVFQMDTACYIMTGLRDNAFVPESEISVNPNPFQDHLDFHLPIHNVDQTQFRWTIYDTTGKICLTGTLPPDASGNSGHIKTHALKAGIYFLSITSPQTDIQLNKKIIRID
ncbi:MAG TPA: T9SS type A sorting domain-containing protein [Bacteroidia bacterium]|nr:T9SS type A sorting domain-containing protein [Bacteroidia bacterium]